MNHLPDPEEREPEGEGDGAHWGGGQLSHNLVGQQGPGPLLVCYF